jgi:hypothetical protein
MGRKRLPIEPYLDKLEQAILIGATYDLAAAYAGISQRTFDRWRAEAQTAPEGTPLAALRDRLRQAEGRAALTWLAQIEKAAREGNWQAAAWKLERRYPDVFARKVQAQIHLDIRQLAQDVAQETGLDPEAILSEAQALLADYDLRHGH